MTGLQQNVTAMLETDPEEFQARVAAEVETVKAELEVGTFDNSQALIGLEYELYGCDTDSGALRRVPRSLLELIRFEKELGVHNAEFTASPQPFGPRGLAAIRNESQAAVNAAHTAAADMEGMGLVSDGFWTLPPVSETAAGYFADAVGETDPIIAANISDAPRYQAMANSPYYSPDCRISTPNAEAKFQTVVPATLTTSIQPHYQVPVAAELPTYLRYAIRIAGPLLAMAVNSPLLPPTIYDAGATVDSVLTEGYMENRVFVFESVMNDGSRSAKVRLPRDIESTADAVERLAADPPITPVCLEESCRFDDRFSHLRHKHSSYWRWIRPVFEGATRADANARIEFRPLPAQPTVQDSVALLAVAGGLLTGLVRADHPVTDLAWEQARENFYSAARAGLAADMQWITASGEVTTDLDDIYTDLFEHARRGLKHHGFDGDTAAQYLHPLRCRVDRRVTPAQWKCDRLSHHRDAGLGLQEGVVAAKRDYLREQRGTLIEGSFVDWPGV